MKKILIVDDSMLIHQMYKMLLTRYKCIIVTAQNGRAGLDTLAQHPDVDLVLLDINMPLMNGLEFISKVKELGVYDHIPIIISSTEGKEDDTRRGIALGARAYVTKPVQAGALHAAIEAVLPSSR